MTARVTALAPPARMVRAASSAVAPVVVTSSTSSTRAPSMACVDRRANAPLDVLDSPGAGQMSLRRGVSDADQLIADGAVQALGDRVGQQTGVVHAAEEPPPPVHRDGQDQVRRRIARCSPRRQPGRASGPRRLRVISERWYLNWRIIGDSGGAYGPSRHSRWNRGSVVGQAAQPSMRAGTLGPRLAPQRGQ